jgi:Flp pilus assembly protein TadD
MATEQAPASGRARTRRDVRMRMLAIAVLGVALGGAALFYWHGRERSPSTGERTAPIDARADPAGHARAMQRAEFDQRFTQAVVMLHARQYEHAVTVLHRLLQIAPEVPELHVNMGFALLGLKDYALARDFFVGATELRAAQANAYYGLAIALEGLGDRPAALGAMRTFVHLTVPDDPWLPKARAALWEWQARSLQ